MKSRGTQAQGATAGTRGAATARGSGEEAEEATGGGWAGATAVVEEGRTDGVRTKTAGEG